MLRDKHIKEIVAAKMTQDVGYAPMAKSIKVLGRGTDFADVQVGNRQFKVSWLETVTITGFDEITTGDIALYDTSDDETIPKESTSLEAKTFDKSQRVT